MKTWLVHIWSRLRTSFWFVPGGVVVLAIVLAYTTIELDRRDWSDVLLGGFELSGVSADGVRSLLSTVATAVLTLAGLTFSATLVALTLASNQFGSRILRNFIRALPNQFTIGMLLGNFTFCLIVLRSVRSVEEGEFVPHLAAFCAFVATLVSLGAFIHFVHHIAVSLQSDRVVADIHDELDRALCRFFPDERPCDPEERQAGKEKDDWEEVEDEKTVVSRRSGYLQAVDIDGLLETCRAGDLRCRVLLHPGQFVHEGEPLLAVDAAGDPTESQLSKLRGHMIVGRIRTSEQDFEFCLRQLVEVALRALSPGINDPFTAMNCIDYLGAALTKVAGRRLPRRLFVGEDREPRVLIRPTVFADLLDASFHQIRQTAGDRPDIAIRLLERLSDIHRATMLDAHLEAVRHHAEAVREFALERVSERDRESIEEAYRRFVDAR